MSEFRIYWRHNSDGCAHLLPARATLTKRGVAVMNGEHGVVARAKLIAALSRHEVEGIRRRVCNAIVLIGPDGTRYGTPRHLAQPMREARNSSWHYTVVAELEGVR